jgi:hypothetical protein
MLFSSLQVGGSVAVPEWLWEAVTNIMSPETDVAELVVTEFAQFLP